MDSRNFEHGFAAISKKNIALQSEINNLLEKLGEFEKMKGAEEEVVRNVTNIINLCKQAKYRIVPVESCTAGLISATLTEVPGSSAVLRKGFVVYSKEAKIDILGVSPATINEFQEVSHEVCEEMLNSKKIEDRDEDGTFNIVIAITGFADDMQNQGFGDYIHQGLAYFGIRIGQSMSIYQRFYKGTRKGNRFSMVRDIFIELLDKIQNQMTISSPPLNAVAKIQA